MNILTFDLEEWYLENILFGGRAFRYQQFDETFGKILDSLDELSIKATFFCVGMLAKQRPDIIKVIFGRGHEVACHSNKHTWLTKMDEKSVLADTKDAISALEDVSGQKVVSYRAPAFSIANQNPWAVEILAYCGIEKDASIFPASRKFGGFKGFTQSTPCIVSYNGVRLKEFPVSVTTILSKTFTYSGGGYFRVLPLWFVNRTFSRRDYSICYFHLNDLINEKFKLKSKKEYEDYFKEPGTLKNRVMRYLKSNIGKGNSFEKLFSLVSAHQFVNLEEADRLIDWNHVHKIELKQNV